MAWFLNTSLIPFEALAFFNGLLEENLIDLLKFDYIILKDFFFEESLNQGDNVHPK